MPFTKEHIIKKTGYVTIVLTTLLLIVAVKVTYIQTVDGKKYKAISKQYTQKRDTIHPNKGNVYTADGSLLATSMYRYEIRLDAVTIPDKIFNHPVKFPSLCKKLSQLLGKSPNFYAKRITRARQQKKRYLLIAKNLSYPQYQKIKNFPIFNLGPYKGGFIAIQNTVREHPLGKIAKRTIGYGYKGMPGIEGAFANELKGQYGVRLKQKIANGQWKPIGYDNEIDPIDGKDVTTTLDLNMQDITHTALLKQLRKYNALHGCAVLMEVETGDIKAIANLGKSKTGNSYYEDRNYAVYEAHEPGSTFKIASLMVALEDKVVDTDDVIDTEGGRWHLNGRVIEDSHTDKFEKLSLSKIIEVSSNVGIAKIIHYAYKKNPEKFISGIKNLGLGQKLGIPIKGEGKPYIIDTKSKYWGSTSLAWLSFGYGVKLTPLQILTFYNAIANNGKMVKPRFVKEVSQHNKHNEKTAFPVEVIKKKIASKKTLKKIIKILKNTVKHGTASNIYSPNYSLAGKTGTCQALYWTNNMYHIASFAGFFPSENPKYSCIVVIHNPSPHYYGNIVAAPVFRDIAHKIYAATPTIWTVTEGESSFTSLENKYNSFTNDIKTPISMPNLNGDAGMDAISKLENMGLKVKYSGTGAVVEQSIEPGTSIKEGDTVYLKLS